MSRLKPATRRISISRDLPSLLARRERERVPVEGCPTSNGRLQVVPSVAVKPVKSFLDAGVFVVVSSDDPSLFGTDVVEEHVRLHREAGVPLATLAACAASSFDAALMPQAEREERFAGAKRCLLYTSSSPRDKRQSRRPSSA